MGYGNGGSYGAATGGTYAGSDVDVRSLTGLQTGAAQRQSHTGDQVSRLEKHVETLHMALSELDARLHPVLLPDAPNVEKAGGNPSLPVSLAQVLATSNDKLEIALRRLQSVITRIDL